jgi:hypothetical protein
MICDKEAHATLLQKVPGITMDLLEIDEGEVFKTLECLTAYAKAQIREGHIEEVNQCFQTARDFLHEGEQAVRCATENIFVYAISQLVSIPDASREIRKMFRKCFAEQHGRFLDSNYP